MRRRADFFWFFIFKNHKFFENFTGLDTAAAKKKAKLIEPNGSEWLRCLNG